LRIFRTVSAFPKRRGSASARGRSLASIKPATKTAGRAETNDHPRWELTNLHELQCATMSHSVYLVRLKKQLSLAITVVTWKEQEKMCVPFGPLLDIYNRLLAHGEFEGKASPTTKESINPFTGESMGRSNAHPWLIYRRTGEPLYLHGDPVKRIALQRGRLRDISLVAETLRDLAPFAAYHEESEELFDPFMLPPGFTSGQITVPNAPR